MITLKKEAEQYFNEKYQEFLFQLNPPAKEKKKKKSHSSVDHLHTITLKNEDIINLTSISLVDGFGKQLSRYFSNGVDKIGLDKTEYNKFEEIALKLSEKKEILNTLSKKDPSVKTI